MAANFVPVVGGHRAGPRGALTAGHHLVVLRGRQVAKRLDAVFAFIGGDDAIAAQAYEMLEAAFERGGPAGDLAPGQEEEFLRRLLATRLGPGDQPAMAVAMLIRREVIVACRNGARVYWCRGPYVSDVMGPDEDGDSPDETKVARLAVAPRDSILLVGSEVAEHVTPEELEQAATGDSPAKQVASWLVAVAVLRSSSPSTALVIQFFSSKTLVAQPGPPPAAPAEPGTARVFTPPPAAQLDRPAASASTPPPAARTPAPPVPRRPPPPATRTPAQRPPVAPPPTARPPSPAGDKPAAPSPRRPVPPTVRIPTSAPARPPAPPSEQPKTPAAIELAPAAAEPAPTPAPPSPPPPVPVQPVSESPPAAKTVSLPVQATAAPLPAPSAPTEMPSVEPEPAPEPQPEQPTATTAEAASVDVPEEPAEPAEAATSPVQAPEPLPPTIPARETPSPASREPVEAPSSPVPEPIVVPPPPSPIRPPASSPASSSLPAAVAEQGMPVSTATRRWRVASVSVGAAAAAAAIFLGVVLLGPALQHTLHSSSAARSPQKRAAPTAVPTVAPVVVPTAAPTQVPAATPTTAPTQAPVPTAIVSSAPRSTAAPARTSLHSWTFPPLKISGGQPLLALFNPNATAVNARVRIIRAGQIDRRKVHIPPGGIVKIPLTAAETRPASGPKDTLTVQTKAPIVPMRVVVGQSPGTSG